MDETKPLPLSAFCCQNERCPQYGKRDAGNLQWRSWGNRTKTIRRLQCRVCRDEFSERKGTPFFQTRISIDRALSIARHLAEGNGIRKTSRLLNTPQNTVMRINRLLGEHGKALHDEKARGLEVKEAQADEMWAFVGKKTKAVRPK